MKKLFISHASEDKDDFVRPLAEALLEEFKVWYDEYSLIVGMSLLRQINAGLIESDYGIVVLSPAFFSKKWPQDELDGLYALEEKNKKVILPIWKDIEFEQVKKYSPILAGKFAAKANDGIEKVVNEIKRSISYFERGRSVESLGKGLSKFTQVLQQKAEMANSKKVAETVEGVHLAYKAAKETIALIIEHGKAIKDYEGFPYLSIGDQKDTGNHCSVSLNFGMKFLYVGYYNDISNNASYADLTILIGEHKDRYRKEFNESTKREYAIYFDTDKKPYWIYNNDYNTLQTPEQLVDYWLGIFADHIEKER